MGVQDRIVDVGATPTCITNGVTGPFSLWNRSSRMIRVCASTSNTTAPAMDDTQPWRDIFPTPEHDITERTIAALWPGRPTSTEIWAYDPNGYPGSPIIKVGISHS